MPGTSQPNFFRLTWKMTNIHLANLPMNDCISTEKFQVGLLQNTHWKLLFLPRGINNPLFMGCTLERISKYADPEQIKLRWAIGVLAEGGRLRFVKHFISTLNWNDFASVPCFIPLNELQPTDMPHNNLTIFCEMMNDDDFSLEQDLNYDYESLSSDLRDLLESGFRSDFSINCLGEIFNVHKFILVSRWPDFCQSFEIDDITTAHELYITGIKSATLRAFLTFLYSGKLQREDISMELCRFMHEQYCDHFMASLETPFSSREFVTHMRYEFKQLIWEVGGADVWKTRKTPFFRVIPLEHVYPSELAITFDFEKRDGVEWLKLAAVLIGFTDTLPVLVDGQISFINKETVVCSSKFNYLLETSNEWDFPWLVKKDDLFPNERNSKCIELRLSICDGHFDTRQVSAKIDTASSFREVTDYRRLMLDLTDSKYDKDLKLNIGVYSFMIHSPIFAARSAKFRELLENNDGEIELEYMSAIAAKSFENHLYGQQFLELDIADTVSLRILAAQYLLPSLEERARKVQELLLEE